MKKFLLVSIGGLGDTILFSPLLRALRNSHPKAYIELLVSNRLALEVYQSADCISRISFANSNKTVSILKAASLLPFVFGSLKNGQFDAGYFATGLNPKIGKILKYTGAVKHIFSAPTSNESLTDLDCNLMLSHTLDRKINKKDVFVPITKKGKFEAESVLRDHNISSQNGHFIAIYPSTNLNHRPRWRLSKLHQVIRLLRKDCRSAKIVVLGSKFEGIEWEEIDKEKIADANLAGKLSISGSIALLSKCALTVGNDGGLMHVAGVVSSSIVTIMANAPLSYRPSGENVKVINSKLDCCRGLYPNRPKNCLIAHCAENIKVEEVYNACIGSLQKITE